MHACLMSILRLLEIRGIEKGKGRRIESLGYFRDLKINFLCQCKILKKIYRAIN